MRSVSYGAAGAAATLVLAFSFLGAGCGGAEARKASFLERGDRYFAEHNYDKARVEYRNAVQIDPADARGHFGVARVAEKLADVKDAVAQYQATVDLDPKHALARAALARLYMMGGLTDRALELVTEGLKDAPNHPQLLTVRAAIRSNKNDLAGALADAQAAYASAPDDEYAIALLASLYRRNNEPERALETIRAGIEKLPTNVDLRVVYADLALSQSLSKVAEEQLKEVVKLQPNELVHRFRLARFYAAAKQLDAAEAALREAIGVKPDDATAKMALIEFLASLRDLASAERQLQDFVAQNPKDYPLKLQLGAFYEQREQFDRAETTYREVAAAAGTKPDGLSARNRLAAMLLKRNDADAARILIDEVLKENPRDSDALVMRGNLALARGDATGAVTDLRSVLRDQPTSIPVLRALARAHLQNHETALAEEALRNAVQINPRDSATQLDLAKLLAQSNKLEPSRAILTELCRATPVNVDAFEALVRVELARKDFASARAAARKIVEARADLGIGYFLSGAVEEADGKVDAAAALYAKALSTQPRAAEPLTALVRIELARKKPEKALEHLDQALQLDPRNAFALNLRSEVQLSQRKFSAAEKDYLAAIELQPRWWIPYRGLAITRAGEGDIDGAKAALSRGIDATGGAGQLYAELGALCERQRQNDCAIETYEQWLKRDPKATLAANNLAMLLVTHRTDSASLKRAREVAMTLSESNDSAILDTRGWVDYKSGNYGQAIDLFERAIAQLPKESNTAAFKYHLGMAQLAKGDQQSARKNLEEAIGTAKSFLGVEEAQAALKQLQRAGA